MGEGVGEHVGDQTQAGDDLRLPDTAPVEGEVRHRADRLPDRAQWEDDGRLDPELSDHFPFGSCRFRHQLHRVEHPGFTRQDAFEHPGELPQWDVDQGIRSNRGAAMGDDEVSAGWRGLRQAAVIKVEGLEDLLLRGRDVHLHLVGRQVDEARKELRNEAVELSGGRRGGTRARLFVDLGRHR
jgi:hypothetical protein